MNNFFRLSAVALAGAVALCPHAASADTASEAALAKKVEQLDAQLHELKAELAELRRQAQDQRAASAQTASAVSAAPAVSADMVNGVAASASATGEPATVLGGYGEINVNNYTKDSSKNTADMRRFVLSYQHRFDERTKVVTELELEHAVASASDSGEVEVEQAYMERQLSPAWALRAGLFLIPAGLLNENHEPTAYYGVERNFVETAIIPSTWREGGVQFVGSLNQGLTVQAGLSTGFNLSKWDAGPDSEGKDSPLGSVHQELQQAKSRDLSLFGAVNWRGVPGLQLGASLFSGDAGQASTPGGSMRVSLWDVHARYTPGRWDLSALFAQGHIADTAAFNLTKVGNPYLVPERFDGWYLQAAYQLWSSGDYVLSPFVRYERYNTQAAFADLGAGLTPPNGKAERVITWGANFQFAPGLVFKADVQRFGQTRDNDRVDLGLGWSF